jgi:hypothetical protein
MSEKPLEPFREWLSTQETIKAYPIGQTTLFDLVRRGCIKSAVLRSPGSLKGRRLIYRPSLDKYLLDLADDNERAMRFEELVSEHLPD